MSRHVSKSTVEQSPQHVLGTEKLCRHPQVGTKSESFLCQTLQGLWTRSKPLTLRFGRAFCPMSLADVDEKRRTLPRTPLLRSPVQCSGQSGNKWSAEAAIAADC